MITFNWLLDSLFWLLIFGAQVMSVTLDEWSDDQIDSMLEVGGNSYANSIYEAFLPAGYLKPNPNSTYDERAEFIRLVIKIYAKWSWWVLTMILMEVHVKFHLLFFRSKYELQEFLKPSLRIVSSKSSHLSSDSGKDKHSSSSFNSPANAVSLLFPTTLALCDLVASMTLSNVVWLSNCRVLLTKTNALS